MQKRKLQIFLSSTYEDLIDHRLAAMEAILAAGHIPAAMEQFSPGDETAWEKIKTWIDESDAFILILGGRYGSIEPTSGKSYVQMEYEYAMAQKKPFFAVVVDEKHHEQRVKELGLVVDERKHPDKYKAFRELVTQRLCSFWNDQKDIKTAVFQKLPEWAQRPELKGWVRGEDAASPQVMNELARLSEENRELRAASQTETFDGLSFEELIGLLRQRQLDPSESLALEQRFPSDPLPDGATLLDFFKAVYPHLHPRFDVGAAFWSDGNFKTLASFGIVEYGGTWATATNTGRRFYNKLRVREHTPTGSTPIAAQ